MAESAKKILVVDDDKMNIVALAHYLKPPYEILVAMDGSSAIKAASKHLPDMILLDIVMPDMNGFDVCAELKAYETTMNIPVIFLTGLDADDIIEKGLALGAVDYITKPFDKSVVKSKIDAHLNPGEALLA